MIHKDRNIQQRLFEINAKKIVLKEERFTIGDKSCPIATKTPQELTIKSAFRKRKLLP